MILGYDRDNTTNTMLRMHVLEVIEVPGSELGRDDASLRGAVRASIMGWRTRCGRRSGPAGPRWSTSALPGGVEFIELTETNLRQLDVE